MLTIKDLDSWYGKIQVLHTVKMHIDPGEIVSIIGPNGAGKSTILKNIFGLIEKRNGKIFFDSKNIIKKRPEDITRLGITYVPQGRSVFPNLTVHENLEMGGFIRNDDLSEDLDYIYKKFPRLKERQDQKAGLLSGGEQQMVAIGRALMLKPKLLLLDEPSLGLSPQMKILIFEKIIEINSDGVAMFIVEQNAKMSLKISDRAYVLELGKNKLQGKGKDMLKNKDVAKLYLGGG
ncbi:ABC transporter ATP-binding protein [Candidatus Woesearchaeota archaeon]|nr:ABC transporter ATP-binding protein [Candidatus Woesearchaeota archaeon]